MTVYPRSVTGGSSLVPSELVGELPIGVPEDLGEIQILAKSILSS